jgi:hypothetical protein
MSLNEQRQHSGHKEKVKEKDELDTKKKRATEDIITNKKLNKGP